MELFFPPAFIKGLLVNAPLTAAPASTPLDRTYTHRLHALAKITDRATQLAYEDEVGIPISEGRCLAAIGSFHPLSVNDLAMRANLNKAQASRSTQALVDQGMVLKQASELDGRGVVLSLTPKGQALWEKVIAIIARRNAEIMAALTNDEQAQLDYLLDRLIQHARKTSRAD